MASTSQIRGWWTGYDCNTLKYVRVAFPGVDKQWPLYVADRSRPIWEAVSQIMSSTPYLFREAAGGSYVCRDIGGTGNRSLHAYALALDLNPKANPHRAPLTHDYPASFIERMEGIRANGKKALQWGGRWTSKPDAMHWQIDVAPTDCRNVTWDRGDDDDMALSAEDKSWITNEVTRLLGGGPTSWLPPGETKTRTGNDGIINSVWWAVAYGRKFMDTIEETHDAAVSGGSGGLVAHTHAEGTTGPAKAS